MFDQRIYLDNCVTTQPAPEVLAAMQPFLTEEFWYPASFVSTGERINAVLDEFRSIIAKTINAQAAEIHFTSGGTLANNIAIKGIVSANVSQGRHIICSVVDYPDLLTNAAHFENTGFEVTYLAADGEAYVSPDELRKAIRPDTILFMTTAVNHVVGTIQPLAEYGKILADADHKIYFHVDAGQAYAKMKLDVVELGIDTMAVSGHKIHAPQGIGFLFVNKGTKVGQVIHGVRRIDNLQTGGISVALIAGLARATEMIFSDLDRQIDHLYDLSQYLLDGLESSIDHIELNGARERRRAGHNINVSIDYIEGEAIALMLDLEGITVATGSACASQGLQPNYILMAIGKNHVQSHGSIKFTLSRYTTREQIDRVVEKLAAITRVLRSRSPLYQALSSKER